jgi:N-acetylglutamate synthase-like GNAT family acetyltransferase
MHIRHATAADASNVAALVTLAYRVEAFFVDGDRTDENDVRKRLERGEFLMLEEQGALVGCVYVEARRAIGYFGMLSIEPRRQGEGHGARLVGAAEQWCARKGCTAVEIEVVDLRTELPPFYRKLGYAEQGTRPFPDPERCKLPCHFIVMRKALT